MTHRFVRSVLPFLAVIAFAAPLTAQTRSPSASCRPPRPSFSKGSSSTSASRRPRRLRTASADRVVFLDGVDVTTRSHAGHLDRVAAPPRPCATLRFHAGNHTVKVECLVNSTGLITGTTTDTIGVRQSTDPRRRPSPKPRRRSSSARLAAASAAPAEPGVNELHLGALHPPSSLPERPRGGGAAEGEERHPPHRRRHGHRPPDGRPRPLQGLQGGRPTARWRWTAPVQRPPHDTPRSTP